MGTEEPGTDRGCLRLALAGPFLLIAAPVVASLRFFARLRRGKEQRIRVGDAAVIPGSSGDMKRIRGVIDFPSGVDVCRELTSAAARLASRVGRGGFHYVLYRDKGSDENVVTGIGPAIQEFAERFLITCRRSSLEDRSVLFLAVGREIEIGRYLDPGGYDPDASGEPEGLFRRMPFQWGLVMLRRRKTASTLFDVTLVVASEEERHAVEFFRCLQTGPGAS